MPKNDTLKQKDMNKRIKETLSLLNRAQGLIRDEVVECSENDLFFNDTNLKACYDHLKVVIANMEVYADTEKDLVGGGFSVFPIENGCSKPAVYSGTQADCVEFAKINGYQGNCIILETEMYPQNNE